MSNLALCYPDHVSAHLPASITSHAISHQNIDELIAARDKEALQLTNLIDAIEPNRQALSVAFDAFYYAEYPKPNDIQTSTNEIAMQSGFRKAQSHMTSKPWDKVVLLKSVDARYWAELIKRSAISEHLSYKAKESWMSSINTGNTPAFTRENIVDTLKEWAGMRVQFFLDRIETLWESLSKEHKTNQKSYFASTLILPNDDACIFSELRQIVATTLGRPAPMTGISGSSAVFCKIRQDEEYGSWLTVDGGAFEVKVYRKGTVHVRLHPETAAKMNDILAMKFPLAIANTARTVSKADKLASRPLTRVEDMLPAHVLNQLYDKKVFNKDANTHLARTLKLPSDSPRYWTPCSADIHTDTRRVLTWLGATFLLTETSEVACFDYDISDALGTLLRKGTLPNIASYQFYPTRGEVGEIAAHTLFSHLNDDGTFNYCEPHGGHGDLAAHLPQDRTTVVELSDINAHILSAKGYDVTQTDFLKYAKTTTARFNGVLMNPPFKDMQAYIHTAMAMSLLKDNGVLVSIMPSSARCQLIKDYSKHYTITHSEPYCNQFDDANVTVEVVTVIKK